MSISKPASREELVEYCLRRLGKPVININISEFQIQDLVDDALQFYTEYNTEGVEKTYLKHQITQAEIDRQSAVVSIEDSTNIAFNDNATDTNPDALDSITYTLGGLITLGFKSGQIIKITGSGSNDGKYTISSVSDTTITLTKDDQLTAEAEGSIITMEVVDMDGGGYIELHPSVMNVDGIFQLTSDNLSSGQFSVQYQFMLNNAHDISYGGLINYTETRSYLTLLQRLFTGDKSVRYKRVNNRLYLDVNWKTTFTDGDYIIVECYRRLDPDSYPKIYNDIFLKKYLTSLFKKQWGSNLKKYSGMALPGGIVMNGQQIYEEAIRELAELEQEVQSKYEEPVNFFIG